MVTRKILGVDNNFVPLFGIDGVKVLGSELA